MARNINVRFVVGEEVRHSKVVRTDDRCQAIISEWERFANVDPSYFILTTDSGHQLRSNAKIGELVPGASRSLEVFVHRPGTSTNEELIKPKNFGPDAVCIASDPQPKRKITYSACGLKIGDCQCRRLPPSYEQSQAAQQGATAMPVLLPAPVTAHFFISWFVRGEWKKDFLFKVERAPPVLAGYLRAALAEERKVRASNLQLELSGRGRRWDGAAVVRSSWGGWRTEGGERVRDEEVEEKEREVLLEDEDRLFVFPEGSALLIDAHV